MVRVRNPCTPIRCDVSAGLTQLNGEPLAFRLPPLLGCPQIASQALCACIVQTGEIAQQMRCTCPIGAHNRQATEATLQLPRPKRELLPSQKRVETLCSHENRCSAPQRSYRTYIIDLFRGICHTEENDGADVQTACGTQRNM